jgi:Family of unknown function (DUF6111)
MIRPIATELALFLTPFALYALFLWVTKRGGVLDLTNWPLTHILYLLVASFMMVIVGFFVLAHWGGAPPGSTYTPAHIEDGKLVPGETKPRQTKK